MGGRLVLLSHMLRLVLSCWAVTVLPACWCVLPTNIHRMLFDGNEEEYEDFYDYSAANTQEPAGAAADEASPAASSSSAAAADGQQLALALDGLSLGDGAAGGWELAIPSQGPGGGSKILGSRELARYYKQRPKPQDNRQSVIVNTIIAQYRSGRRPVGCPCQHLRRFKNWAVLELKSLFCAGCSKVIVCALHLSFLHILTRLSTQHMCLLSHRKTLLRPPKPRTSACRSLGLATKTSTPPVVQRAAQRQQQAMAKRQQYLLYSRNNVNFNLPKNVTY